MGTTHRKKLFEQATSLLTPLGFQVVEFWKGSLQIFIELPTDVEAKALLPQVADILNENGLWAQLFRMGSCVSVYILEECRPGEALQIIDD